MALNDLKTGEMLSLTAPWVTKEHPDRDALAGVSTVAPLLPFVESAHHGLLHSQPIGGGDRLNQIQVEARTLDLRHDDVLRGLDYVATGMALLAKDESARVAWTNLRELLFPEGIGAAIQKSYRDEAGQALLVKARLGAEGKALLGKVKHAEGTLYDSVHEWMELAAQLGTLEDEREKVGSGATPAEARAARHQWIRVVSAIAGNLDLIADLDEDVRVIRDRVRNTAAARRGASSTEDTTPEPPTPPTPLAPTGPTEGPGVIPPGSSSPGSLPA